MGAPDRVADADYASRDVSARQCYLDLAVSPRRYRAKRSPCSALQRCGHARAQPASAVDAGQGRLRREEHRGRVRACHEPYDANRRVSELFDRGSQEIHCELPDACPLRLIWERMFGWAQAGYTVRRALLPPLDACSRLTLWSGCRWGFVAPPRLTSTRRASAHRNGTSGRGRMRG